jgi:uncharacterized zinc-type alcohol dehydrogenase-like protein
MAHMKAKSFAAKAVTTPHEYFEFDRREPSDSDVEIEIHYCGVCHSDLHTARGDWGEVAYPCVPGHEIVGLVTRVGKDVTHFKQGDRVGVGCMVNSCGECEACQRGFEISCFKETIQPTIYLIQLMKWTKGAIVVVLGTGPFYQILWMWHSCTTAWYTHLFA